MPKYYTLTYVNNSNATHEIFNIVKTNNDTNIYECLAYLYMKYRENGQAYEFDVLFDLLDKAIEKSCIQDVSHTYVKKMIQYGENSYGINGMIKITEHKLPHI